MQFIINRSYLTLFFGHKHSYGRHYPNFGGTWINRLYKNHLEKKYTWYRIAGSAAEIPFKENDMAIVEVNGKKISMARLKGKLFAFAYKCPHASGILTEGWLDPKENIVCPVHKYRFNIENGRNTTGEGYRLTCWPVEKRPEGIFVGMEDNAFGG